MSLCVSNQSPVREPGTASLVRSMACLMPGTFVMSLPRASAFRSFLLSHVIHHRGQLTVYLRELGVPIPSIYGPSADENPFA